MLFLRHAGLEEPAPYLNTGASRCLPDEGWELSQTLDVLARYGSLRLPSVARLEFTPYLIRGRNDNLFEIGDL